MVEIVGVFLQQLVDPLPGNVRAIVEADRVTLEPALPAHGFVELPHHQTGRRHVEESVEGAARAEGFEDRLVDTLGLVADDQTRESVLSLNSA